MAKEAKLLECTGSSRPGTTFLLEYQKAVLFSLKEEGLIDQAQMEECIQKLERSGPAKGSTA